MTRDVKIALYGDVNLNVIDGSSVWLQSLAMALAHLPRVAVTVVLKAGEQRDLLTAPLRRLPGVRVVNPVDAGTFSGPELTRNQALDALESLDEQERFDAFIVRGLGLCHTAAVRKRPTFTGRMWPYLTDFPQRPEELTPEALGQLDTIAAASRYVLCQTEAMRVYLEAYVPAAADKAVLLEPMIPDEVPAVMMPGCPSTFGKTGPSFLRDSIVVSGRGCSSASTVT